MYTMPGHVYTDYITYYNNIAETTILYAAKNNFQRPYYADNIIANYFENNKLLILS